jgi:SHS2 domain-containing protein
MAAPPAQMKKSVRASFFAFPGLFSRESKKVDAEGDGAVAAAAAKQHEQTRSGYEYLDHTADVQLHSWAPTLKEALELVVVAMFGYITELGQVDESDELDVQVEATGHDMDSLLYSLMDEFLFQFCTEYSVCKRVEIVTFDRENWKIVARGFGETYDKKKHVPGEKQCLQLICKSEKQIKRHRNQSDYVLEHADSRKR